MDFIIEAYRSEVDDLTERVLAQVAEVTAGFHATDRDIIVSAALANAACRLGAEVSGGVIIIEPESAAARLKRVAIAWRGGE